MVDYRKGNIMAGTLRFDDQQGQFNLASGASGMTLQAYRDTGFVIEHCRYDQDDVIGYFKFQFTHRKRLDSVVLSLHIHCIPVGANPASEQTVRFEYSYVWVNSDDIFPAVASWTTSFANLVVGTYDQYYGRITEIVADITPPDPEDYSSWLLVMITRAGTDALDSYVESNPDGLAAANLVILGVDCHIIVDRLGSLDELSD